MALATATAENSLRQNGKTFHWARRFLGRDMGPAAAQLYAFCRILDDMADGDIPDGPSRLDTIYRNLNAKNPITDPDLAPLSAFMQDHGLPIEVLQALIDGLLMDQGVVALETDDDIIRYGYHVAGTVGVLMCPILKIDTAVPNSAHYHAIDMGIGMQLTNIARDVLEDAQMGRRYLPASWVDGLSASAIANAARDGNTAQIAVVRSATQRLLGIAERYYDSGMAGLSYLPRRAHLAILIAGKAYRQIGLQLARNGTNWHLGRTVTSTQTKFLSSLKAAPQLHHRLRAIPPHDALLHLPLKGLPYAHQH